jgi:hypothetical protein
VSASLVQLQQPLSESGCLLQRGDQLGVLGLIQVQVSLA